jgi:dienelactone hydrolase
MTYDPFARGQFPVGVRSLDATDSARNRALALELWYPATDAHQGQDLVDPTRDRYDLLPGFPPVSQDAVREAALRSGRYPLILFSHGFGGHRRQSTFLCTHLASHGYVVAAVDHTGNTVADMMMMFFRMQSGESVPDPLGGIAEFVALRPPDVQFVLDALLDGIVPELGPAIDPTRVGMSGHSFGGWTTLMVAAREHRIGAALPLAPAGGWTVVPINPLSDALDFDWPQPVPTLYLVAERDSLLPLRGMEGLFERTRPPKRLITLQNADHLHFCDRIEEMHEMFRAMPPPGTFAELAKETRPIGELCPADHAYAFVRGLGLAHFDAMLKGNEAAARLLDDAQAVLQARGIDVVAR